MIRFIITSMLIFLLSAILFCQNTFNDSKEALVEEKILLQTDRDFYITGETLWFRADYLVNNKKGGPELSKVLYVELLNQNGQAVARDKFALQDFVASGNITITEGSFTGYYILRAYTQYQRNFHPEQYASAILTIINPLIPLHGWTDGQDTVIEIAPENGMLIAEVNNRVAIKFDLRLVNNINDALVLDQYHNTITTIKTFPNGLGYFEFIPTDSLNYSLLTVLENHDSIVTDLPKTEKSGLVLQSEINEGSLHVKLSGQPGSGNDDDSDYHLRIYSQGYCLLSETVLQVSERWKEIKRAPKCLGPGLIYLVLKNKEGEIVQVRTMLKPVPEHIAIDVNTNKHSYSKRESVEVVLQADDNFIDEIDQLSVAIVKMGTYDAGSDNLPGYIVKNPFLLPEYLSYRNIQNDSLLEQIEMLLMIYDYLMVTDEKYKANFGPQKEKPIMLPETRGITVRGIVLNKLTGKAVPGVVVYIATIGEEPQFHIYTTDENGEFVSTLNYVEELNSVFLCMRDDREAELEILVKSDFSNVIPSFNDVPVTLDTSSSRFLKELFVNAQLTQTYGSVDTSEIKADNRKPLRFSDPDESILLDDYIELPALENVFDELVPYVKVRKRKGSYYLEVLDNKTNVIYGEPLLLLDNIPIVDVDELMKIHPRLIERIDVINSTYIYGDHILRGIVMVKTKTDDFAGIILPESSTFLEFNAVTYSGQFPVENHALKNKQNNRMPDFRNLLYWKPDVELVDGKTKLSFDVSDHIATYKVVVRGLSKNGKTILGVTSFDVVGHNN